MPTEIASRPAECPRMYGSNFSTTVTNNFAASKVGEAFRFPTTFRGKRK